MKQMLYKLRRLPAGVLFLALCALALVALLPFRMGPVSRSVNGSYWEAFGQHPDALTGMPTHVEAVLPSGGCTLTIDADVALPASPSVPIYRASTRKPDARRIVAAFGLDTAESTSEEIIDRMSYRGYDVLSIDTFYANGYSELNETGRVNLGVYQEEPRELDERSLIELLRAADIITGDATARYAQGDGIWFVNTVLGGIPLADAFSFDAYTRYPNSAFAVMVSQTAAANLLEAKASCCLGEAEVVWEGSNIVPVEEALEAMAAGRARRGMEADMTVDKIQLAYQARTLYGDPHHVMLYPVWELWATGTYDTTAVCVVNAVNGEVEKCIA